VWVYAREKEAHFSGFLATATATGGIQFTLSAWKEGLALHCFESIFLVLFFCFPSCFVLLKKNKISQIVLFRLGFDGFMKRLHSVTAKGSIDGILVANLTVLVDTRLVNRIDPTLIEVNQKDDVIPKTRQTMQCRHFDDEGEKVIDKRIQRLVHESSPRHVRHRFQFVVDEELRRHGHKAKRVDESHGRSQQPRVPA
jgi:hypothetical protein